MKNPEKYFDPQQVIDYCEMLISHDEVERALLVLDNIPAFWRDYPPESLKELRVDINRALITTHAYANSNLDSGLDVGPNAAATLKKFLRGQLVVEEVKKYNDKGITPNIIDMGPGEYFVPFGLKELGLKFNYWDIACDERSIKLSREFFDKEGIKKSLDKASPTIFLCLEVIEHLPSTKDIVIEAMRYNDVYPERVHLSTPMYSYDVGKKDWKKLCGLPHLRAYTPNEFVYEANKLFPGYNWQYYPNECMSLRGQRNDVWENELLIEPDKI